MDLPSETRTTGGAAPHVRLGPPGAPTPLVLAVPHAGRCYPPDILAQARLPRSALETIEDRHADLLIAGAVALGAVAIVAQTARFVVDLNRDPRELDPAILETAPPGLIASEKVTGGLGVVPSRIAAGGPVWRRRLAPAAVEGRIATLHAPYHAAIRAALDAAHAQHGIALLIDCHSMPPLLPGAPRLVLGDRHGASIAQRFVHAAEAAARVRGMAPRRNRPYAGGYTLDHHAAPRAGRHALQIEVDRTLYLDTALREPGAGLGRMQGVIAAIAQALLDEAMPIALAAE